MLAHLHFGNLLFHAPTVGHVTQPVLMGLAGSWIALLFHELGHAVAALLLGVRIWGIRLGVGPTVWRGTIGSCRINVALFPFLGIWAIERYEWREPGITATVEEANAAQAGGTWRMEVRPRADGGSILMISMDRQAKGFVGHLVHGLIEKNLVGLRWLVRPAHFPDELQSGRADLVAR